MCKRLSLDPCLVKSDEEYIGLLFLSFSVGTALENLALSSKGATCKSTPAWVVCGKAIDGRQDTWFMWKGFTTDNYITVYLREASRIFRLKVTNRAYSPWGNPNRSLVRKARVKFDNGELRQVR